jgi:hypothetical protein
MNRFEPEILDETDEGDWDEESDKVDSIIQVFKCFAAVMTQDLKLKKNVLNYNCCPLIGSRIMISIS